MTRLLIDTSVLIKWFHSHGETEVPQARALRAAHLNGGLDAHALDSAYYELGNALIRALGWTANDVADQLDDLTTMLGPRLDANDCVAFNKGFRLAGSSLLFEESNAE